MDVRPVLASLEELGPETDLRPALALLAGRELAIDDAELNPPLRRAMLLLAAGGDPHNGLVLDGRAVVALADELDTDERRAELRQGLAELQAAGTSGHVAAAVGELVAEDRLAWRAYACGLLAEQLD